MSLIVSMPAEREPERRYVVELVLGEWLGLEHHLEFGPVTATRIRQAEDPDGPSVSMPDTLLGSAASRWLRTASLPPSPVPRAALPPRLTGSPAGPSRATVPVLFGRSGADAPVSRRVADGVDLDVDIFGSVFFLVTGYEGHVLLERDRYGRVPADRSVLVREGLEGRALVDEYLDVLWSALAWLWPGLSRPERRFRLRLTHDVDHAWAGVARAPGVVAHAAAGDLLRRHDPGLAARRLRAFAAGRIGMAVDDPFFTFDWLMTTSERHGLQSLFYFMVGGGHSPLGASYTIEDPRVVQLLRAIHDRGHEVGLHGSLGSARSSERLGAELVRLQRACRSAGFDQDAWSVRQHYLSFEPSVTWRAQDEAGFLDDSTVGFAERVGFRAGTGRECPVFDLLERRPLRLRERPLLVMDAALLGYLRLDLDEARSRALAILDVCRAAGTDAVVLYHNSTLVGRAEKRHYRDLVDASLDGPPVERR